MAYATLDQLKARLGIPPNTIADDDLLQELLDEAKDYIESAEGAGRVFEAADDTTRYFHAVRDVCDQTLFLNADLCAITTITNGDGSALSNTQYVTWPANSTPYYAIELKQGSSLAWTYRSAPENAIAITGRWGYSTTAPARVRNLHRALAAWMYRQKEGNPETDRTLSTPGGVVLMPGSMPQHIVRELRALRKVSL